MAEPSANTAYRTAVASAAGATMARSPGDRQRQGCASRKGFRWIRTRRADQEAATRQKKTGEEEVGEARPARAAA